MSPRYRMYTKTAVFSFFLLSTQSVFGAAATMKGTISNVLLDYNYGGCMALVETEKQLAEYAVNCPNNYFTFDCHGELATPGGRWQSMLKIQQAQIALINKLPVTITVLDDYKIDGRCWVSRIIMHQEP